MEIYSSKYIYIYLDEDSIEWYIYNYNISYEQNHGDIKFIGYDEISSIYYEDTILYKDFEIFLYENGINK